MARQGKCDRDRIRYEWHRDVPIERVYCPKCGDPLKKTNRLCKYRLSKVVPVITQGKRRPILEA